LGSVRLLTDTSGNSASAYNYSAFGATRTSSGSVVNEVRFSGERTDTESGLEFLRARTYDPATGTFLSRDTWGITPTDGQSLDLYAYTGNDPIDRVDPSGHCWGICIDIKPPSLPIPDLSAAAHSALGVVSIVPGPIGSAAAVADAGLYAYEGDYESAAISLVAVVPFGGPILSKGEQALKVVTKVREADRVATAGADIEKAAKAIDKAESTVSKFKKWEVGDPINAPTAAGKDPVWRTVQNRYWKNEAASNPTAYTPDNLERMTRGRAPLHPTERVSKELHHIDPQRSGGPNTLENLLPVWPWEHAAIDPFRHYGRGLN
jgi:RHS repeat-associated protein